MICWPSVPGTGPKWRGMSPRLPPRPPSPGAAGARRTVSAILRWSVHSHDRAKGDAMSPNEPYEKRLLAGWGDMDFNSHMRNTAYLDKSADVRMLYFSEHGFPMSQFMRMKLGPVIQKDELEYVREVHLLDELKVTLAIAGLSEDGSRWLMRNEFFRSDGKLAARVSSVGGWLDLAARRLAPAPAELLEVLGRLPKTQDFQTLPSSLV